LEWLELLADQAALGIENQRRFAAEVRAQQLASRANFWLELRHKSTNQLTDAQTQKEVFDVIRSGITWAFPETKPLLVPKRDFPDHDGTIIVSDGIDASFEPLLALLEKDGPFCDAAWHMLGRETAPAELRAIWRPDWENVVLCPLHHQQNLFGFFIVPFRHNAALGQDEIPYLQQLANKSCSALLRIDLIMQVRRSEQEAKKLSAMQNVLMGIVGHDLRNPLAAIRMGGGLLQQMLPNETRTLRLVQRIVRTAARAEGLIQQLLDFSVLHAGHVLALKRCTGNASKWVEELVDEIRLSHPHRRIEVQVPENIHVRWDRERMAQAWSNLILNALHYGEAGREVRIEMEPKADQVELRVWNHGPALTSDAFARLFEPFERGEKKSAPGCGLGLYIVREVIRSHGGQIDVHSADGQTCFTLRVPAADEQIEREAAMSERRNANWRQEQQVLGQRSVREQMETQEVRAVVYA
jgi:signal transduction histidine kinase